MSTEGVGGQERIHSRLVTSLLGNLVRGLLTLAIGVTLARLLGPNDFGRIAFLLATFQALRQLLDPGITSAFFTFLSKRNESVRFVTLFWVFTLAKYLLSISILIWILPDAWIDYVWRGEQRDFLVFSLTAVMVQYEAHQCAAFMLEAKRKTALSHILNIIGLLAQLVAILILNSIDALNIVNFLMASSAIFLITTCIAINASFKNKTSAHTTNESITDSSLLGRYVAYCSPLLPITIIGFLGDFIDRWLLQVWGGAVEQAMYSISQQIAAATLLVTSAFTRVIWKELASALHEGLHQEAREIYTSSKKALFFVSAALCGFICAWSPEIVEILFGAAYAEASVVLTILVISATFQTLGQVEGVLMHASEKTKTGLYFTLVTAPGWILLSYYLLADSSSNLAITHSGLGLGAFGLALKILAVQVVSVNILGYLLSKKTGWNYDFIFQITFLLYFMLSAASIKTALEGLLVSPFNVIFFGGLIYGSFFFLSLYYYKNLFGLNVNLRRLSANLKHGGEK